MSTIVRRFVVVIVVISCAMTLGCSQGVPGKNEDKDRPQTTQEN